MHANERIVIHDEGADLLRETVTREAAPSAELAQWRGCGPARGEYEAAAEVEYLRPTRRAA